MLAIKLIRPRPQLRRYCTKRSSVSFNSLVERITTPVVEKVTATAPVRAVKFTLVTTAAFATLILSVWVADKVTDILLKIKQLRNT